MVRGPRLAGVSRISSSFYADWRVRQGFALSLRDDDDSPPEQLLQAIWQHQRLRRDEFKTLDQVPVRVLHPGFRSVEGGPDFRGAVVRFADEQPRSGDVEVDLKRGGWRSHGHDRNPAFKNVILHVLWEAPANPTSGPPAIAVQKLLDAPLGELSLWLRNDSPEALPEEWRGQCCAPLKELSPERITELLDQAALVRMRGKASQLQARARLVGWDQSLLEGLFRALGYKHNTWPMQQLAELKPRWGGDQVPAENVEARLFGLSGLLPDDLSRSKKAGDDYVKRLWNAWWRERDGFADCLLPRSLWRLHGVRPGNHPQRRLALAARWASGGKLSSKLEQWAAQSIPATRLPSSLLERLKVPSEEFWSWHCTLKSARLKAAQPLLGLARVTDLAVNVVLPWLWARAEKGKISSIQVSIEKRYLDWPAAEDNSLLRLARQRLLGGADKKTLRTAAAQQGLIQIVRDFCEHSNALCDNCRFPEMVREFQSHSRSPAFV